MTTTRRAFLALAGLGLVSAAACTVVPAPGPTPGGPTTTTPPTTVAPPPTTTPGTGTHTFTAGRQVVTWQVDGFTRTAVVVVPPAALAPGAAPVPVIFAFHGHGGSGPNFERNTHFDQLWPDAVVVYPSGLVGHAGKTDPEGVKPGWQTVVGEEGDRDLHLYDAMAADLRASLPVDPDRLYLVGFSNGSAFTSLLFNQRGDQVAATANLSAQPGLLLFTDPVRSMFMMIGEADPIVPADAQKKSIPLAQKKLSIDPSTTVVDGYLTSARGPGNLELATYVHPGGHDIPPEVPPLVVSFLQRHARTDAPA